MPKRIEMIGKKFGKLTVIEESSIRKNGAICWICRCDCGNITEPIRSHNLRYGDTTSCGCIHKEITSKRSTVHGLRKTKLYSIWTNMKRRCNDINASRYERYGGRGITVCEEWKNDFRAFYDWAMSNGYSEELTIDRIDVNGNYEPLNCRWVDMKTQQSNRSDNVKVEYNGSLITIARLSELCGIKQATLYKRFHKGLRGDLLLKGGKAI